MEMKRNVKAILRIEKDSAVEEIVNDVQNEYLLLADGKSRRLEAPKRKKCRHVQRAGAAPEELAAKLRSSEIITNSELRKALAVYRGEHGNQDQEGSTLWQNPT